MARDKVDAVVNTNRPDDVKEWAERHQDQGRVFLLSGERSYSKEFREGNAELPVVIIFGDNSPKHQQRMEAFDTESEIGSRAERLLDPTSAGNQVKHAGQAQAAAILRDNFKKPETGQYRHKVLGLPSCDFKRRGELEEQVADVLAITKELMGKGYSVVIPVQEDGTINIGTGHANKKSWLGFGPANRIPGFEPYPSKKKPQDTVPHFLQSNFLELVLAYAQEKDTTRQGRVDGSAAAGAGVGRADGQSWAGGVAKGAQDGGRGQ